MSSSSWSCFGDSQSNLQRFLQCVTPIIPSQPLPQVFLCLIILFIYLLSNLFFQSFYLFDLCLNAQGDNVFILPLCFVNSWDDVCLFDCVCLILFF